MIQGALAAILVGLFSVSMGLLAWVDPGKVGEVMGLVAPAELGVHSLRGDIGAVFLASALGCALALFKAKPWGLKFRLFFTGLC